LHIDVVKILLQYICTVRDGVDDARELRAHRHVLAWHVTPRHEGLAANGINCFQLLACEAEPCLLRSPLSGTTFLSCRYRCGQ
jgi:hypothetical protein